MALPTATVTSTKIGQGPVVLKYDGSEKGRVIACSMEFGDEVIEVMSGDSAQKITAILQTKAATGKARLTLDEVHDVTAIDGAQANVTIEQGYPKALAGWLATYATAWVKVLSLNAPIGTQTTIEIEITPYGAAPFTFTDAEDYS